MTTGPVENLAPEYVAARTVLLDALDALAAHRSSLVLVGARAVYLRTGSAGLATAPFTTDGDVTLDPRTLGASPLLEDAMQVAGFHLLERPRGIEPGTWIGTTQVAGRRYDVPVDLIVPAAALEGGRTRGARLPDHGKRAAKRTHGLEAALVDSGEMQVRGAAAGDGRATSVAVAGAAALLVAKVVKITERVADDRRPHRQKDKDAADVLRLLRATPVGAMAERLAALRHDPVAGPVTQDALDGLSTLFGSPAAPGVIMAVRAVELDVPAARVEAQMTGYVRELARLLG